MKSKAFKIFIEKEFDFKNENLMQREVLLSLFKDLPDENFKKFIGSLDALPFESYHTNYYIECILNIHKFGGVKDEMLTRYEDQPPSKERLQQILALGSNLNFDLFDAEE